MSFIKDLFKTGSKSEGDGFLHASYPKFSEAFTNSIGKSQILTLVAIVGAFVILNEIGKKHGKR